MAITVADFIGETSTTTGTGSLTLAGAISGTPFRTFNGNIASGSRVLVTTRMGDQFEVAICTFTSPSTLARNTVLSSSNGNALVNWLSGTKTVVVSLPASYALALISETNGFIVQTAEGTFTRRSLSVQSPLQITNSDAVSGNPQISLPDNVSANSYVVPDLTVNAKGVITAITATKAKTFNIPFAAGYDNTWAGLDLEVQEYGTLIPGDVCTVVGEAGYLTTPGTGQAVIVDILKNGTSIYTTRPQFDASSSTLTAGTLNGTISFAATDRITFAVDQIGSGTIGQKLHFTLRCTIDN